MRERRVEEFGAFLRGQLDAVKEDLTRDNDMSKTWKARGAYWQTRMIIDEFESAFRAEGAAIGGEDGGE